MGYRALNRYCRSALIASVAALLLFGCSSTPDNQSLERSISTSHTKSSVPSEVSGVPSDVLSSAPAQATGAPESLGNGAGDDELPQIQPPAGRYILGSGDVVTVTVWGHRELSGKRVIGPDGEIQVPFVGSFRMAGLTADDAGAKLTSALREDYLNTAASITIDSYNSNQVLVLGHVAHPGVLIFSGSPTLLEALAMAGTPNKDDASALPGRCAIIRGRDRIMWINLRPLLKGTDASLNVPLQRNDLVYVPDPNDEQIYVMGQVKNPGPYPLTANMSFLEALSRAGGPSDSAQQGKIILARPSTNQQQVVDLEKLVQQGGTNYQLEAGDIVYVPKSGVAQVGYVVQQLNPIMSMAVFAALF